MLENNTHSYSRRLPGDTWESCVRQHGVLVRLGRGLCVQGLLLFWTAQSNHESNLHTPTGVCRLKIGEPVHLLFTSV
jgi:hypothetical protein